VSFKKLAETETVTVYPTTTTPTKPKLTLWEILAIAGGAAVILGVAVAASSKKGGAKP